MIMGNEQVSYVLFWSPQRDSYQSLLNQRPTAVPADCHGGQASAHLHQEGPPRIHNASAVTILRCKHPDITTEMTRTVPFGFLARSQVRMVSIVSVVLTLFGQVGRTTWLTRKACM